MFIGRVCDFRNRPISDQAQKRSLKRWPAVAGARVSDRAIT
jgi:hypothetical protein